MVIVHEFLQLVLESSFLCVVNRLFCFICKETNSSLTKNLDQANKKKEELEEKIRLLTLTSEEKQVKLPTTHASK